LKLLAVDRLSDLRTTLDGWRAQGLRIGLVPTMGNLHAGHLALVKEARRHCDRVVTSIFVNPTQFGPGEDFESYPRTRQADLEKLDKAGCELAWLPAVAEMYPLAESFMVQPPTSLTETLCGAHRPGHFSGVATVVLRLFNQVAPRVAVFGEKDFQQLLVIRRMVLDLALPIEIRGLETRREADGLAMSSRNQYLSRLERARAAELAGLLDDLAAGLRDGQAWDVLQNQAWQRLEKAGFQPQYLEWRSAEDLGPPKPDRPQRLLAAAWLGKARLIDNKAV
jgi:pantoate--beta-alanine ligase